MACGILVPQTGVELRHSAVTTWSATLNHQGIPEKSLFCLKKAAHRFLHNVKADLCLLPFEIPSSFS